MAICAIIAELPPTSEPCRTVTLLCCVHHTLEKNSNEWKELPSMLWSHIIGQVDKKANRFMELRIFHLFGPLSIRFVHQSPNNQGNRISELRKYNGQLLIAYGWRVYVSEENLADLGLPNVGALTNHPSRNEQSINYQHSLDLSICHDWETCYCCSTSSCRKNHIGSARCTHGWNSSFKSIL